MIAENRGQLVFRADNTHTESCGDPPAVANTSPDAYYGYFENEHREQWVFVYDRKAKRGTLQGGDAGWVNAFEVVDGKAPVNMNPEELVWLGACWKAATRFE